MAVMKFYVHINTCRAIYSNNKDVHEFKNGPPSLPVPQAAVAACPNFPRTDLNEFLLSRTRNSTPSLVQLKCISDQKRSSTPNFQFQTRAHIFTLKGSHIWPRRAGLRYTKSLELVIMADGGALGGADRVLQRAEEHSGYMVWIEVLDDEDGVAEM